MREDILLKKWFLIYQKGGKFRSFSKNSVMIWLKPKNAIIGQNKEN